MSKNNEAPSEVRELEKQLNRFCYTNGFNKTEVFDDLLRYIIGYFTWKPSPLESWRYKKEHNVVFWNMLCEWIQVVQKQTFLHGWYDAFGDLFMACIGSTSRTKNLGQNFTPDEICELMARMLESKAGKDKSCGTSIILDPTCGSGRTLLAAHLKHPKNYIVAEDIDRTCCMMTVCNFIVHGCHGEVIWHDSLNPDSYYGGWLVNEHLGRRGLPSVRAITKEESAIWTFWQYQKQENAIQEALELEK